MSSTIVAESNETLNKRRAEKKIKQQESALSIITSKVERSLDGERRREHMTQRRREMINAAKELEFERAAERRDEIDKLGGG